MDSKRNKNNMQFQQLDLFNQSVGPSPSGRSVAPAKPNLAAAPAAASTSLLDQLPADDRPQYSTRGYSAGQKLWSLFRSEHSLREIYKWYCRNSAEFISEAQQALELASK